MTPSHARIILDHLSLERGSRKVLHDLDTILDGGQLIALSGPNGAGKSTLLAALAGDLRPALGRLWVNGSEPWQQRPEQRARARAILCQNPALTHPFRAAQVVALSGLPVRDCLPLLNELGIEALAERIYPRLSGGEQRLVQLARVLAQAERHAAEGSFPWILLDEPTSQLDLGRIDAVIAALRARARRGWGVLLALHDLELASRVTEHMLLLAGTELLAAGTANEAVTAENLRRGWGIRAQVVPDSWRGGIRIRVDGAEGA